MKNIFNSLTRKYSVIIAVAVFLLLGVLFLYLDKKYALLFVAAAVLYIIAVGIAAYLYQKKHLTEKAKNQLSSLTDKFIINYRQPMYIVSKEEKIIWFNKSFEKLFADESLSYDRSAKAFFDGKFTYSALASYEEVNKTYKIVEEYNGKHLEVSFYPLKTENIDCYMTIWTDNSETEKIINELKLKNLVVAYAMTDNSSDATSNLQENSREASLKISNALREWVASVNGIIKEYERDKYLIFFEEKYLNDIITEKFDILNKINDVYTGESDVYLTVSMGLSSITGSFSEKEESAKSALSVALQRGGAQAILKTDNETYRFGGKTKAVHKETKIRSRYVAVELINLIKKSSNVLIMGHKNTDFDAIASCVGLARLVMHFDKKINIVVNKSDEQYKASLKMLSDLSEYDDVFVDFVKGQDMLSPSTLVIVADSSNPTIFEAPDIVKNAFMIAIIDHHRQNAEFDFPIELSYIDPTASSASELVCEILEQTLPHAEIKKGEAELLLAGMLLDTQSFSRNTGVRTFSAAMYLRGEGGNPAEAKMLLRESLDDYKRRAKFQGNTIVYNKVYSISYYDGDNNEENRVASASAADKMLQIRDIKASFAVCTVDDYVHISARSDGSINVSLILEKLGGGGHFNVAGAQLKGVTVSEAIETLKQAIRESESPD